MFDASFVGGPEGDGHLLLPVFQPWKIPIHHSTGWTAEHEPLTWMASTCQFQDSWVHSGHLPLQIWLLHPCIWTDGGLEVDSENCFGIAWAGAFFFFWFSVLGV